MRPASSMNHACNPPAARPRQPVERTAAMAVTASYNAVQRELFVTGDTLGTLIGGSGDDLRAGGAGADVLSGGDGVDTASYGNSLAAVFVDLDNRDTSGSDAEGDIFSSVENLIGSAFGDNLFGDVGNNVLA